MTSLSPFELVSQNLLSIGALSIDDFLSSGPERLARRDAFHDPSSPEALNPVSSSSKARTATAPTESVPGTALTTSVVSAPPPNTLAQLHRTCLREFGNININGSLKFEFLEEAVDKKQCVLTITRPDGSARSYKTEPVFRRKTDAKIHVATIAVEHGAMDFIMYGDSDELKAKKGVLLAPLDDQPIASTSKISLDSPSSVSESELPTVRVKEIDACCQEWRGDRVKPYWTNFVSSSTEYGAVLKIQLAPHCYRVYTCDPTFERPSDAREHCAELAIGEGVLEFIKYGNGQTAPQSDLSSSSGIPFESTEMPKRDLQSFYDSLPRPFEEPFEEKTAAEISAPARLITLLATAAGGRFTAEFYPLATPRRVPGKASPTDLQGCLFRLKRPGELRAYLVEPQFAGQKDAKAAVSLLALSLGAGKWIREVAAAMEARITPQIRRFAQTSIFPVLAHETQRCSRTKPEFQFHTDGDAFGCRLQVNLKPPEQADSTSIRQYDVPAEYRNKADAKIAVAYLAVQQGVIDLLRHGGQPVFPSLPPAFSVHDGEPHITPNPNTKRKATGKQKQKNGEDSEGPPAKKQKTQVQKTLSVPPTRPGIASTEAGGFQIQ
ncbi:hypothetical protein MVEN_02530100 [Mycena venus]|uniref:Uncharacterized protein n=1 Tax=Mycena venus TaxID=2733690 RepID=A0A8H6WUS9_9AGAR|nr:hypothetical protein MVEN_02530100 [Mycena venus]